MQPLLEAAVIDSQDYYKPLHVDNVQLTIADAEYMWFQMHLMLLVILSSQEIEDIIEARQPKQDQPTVKEALKDVDDETLSTFFVALPYIIGSAPSLISFCLYLKFGGGIKGIKSAIRYSMGVPGRVASIVTKFRAGSVGSAAADSIELVAGAADAAADGTGDAMAAFNIANNVYNVTGRADLGAAAGMGHYAIRKIGGGYKNVAINVRAGSIVQ